MRKSRLNHCPKLVLRFFGVAPFAQRARIRISLVRHKIAGFFIFLKIVNRLIRLLNVPVKSAYTSQAKPSQNLENRMCREIPYTTECRMSARETASSKS